MANPQKVFPLVVSGNRTTEEVIAAGNYDGKNDQVNGKNFPMRPMPDGPREIVYLDKEWDHDPTAEEVLAEAERQGLERPRYEDALFFGEQYSEEQCKAPIIFLHEPWENQSCNSCMLVLYCDSGLRNLGLNYFDFKCSRQCRFAFVRK